LNGCIVDKSAKYLDFAYVIIFYVVLINDNSKVLSIGDQMPSFSLRSTDGMTIESGMIKGPIVVIVFTCNHCPYAQAYEDRLIDLAEHFDEEGVQFVLINSNDAENYPDDSFEAMKEVHDEMGFSFPYCFDETQEIARSYGALCTPHCFVFDSQRKLRYKGQIDDNWENPAKVKKQTLKNALSALISGEEVEVSEANAIGCSIKWKVDN